MGLLGNTTQQQYYNGTNHGDYQFTSLNDIINQFIIAYVGENKIISKAKRVDVAFHAQRALQELSFDTLKSIKAQEITVPATLQMTLPQDYVNYTKVSWVDGSGIKHVLYPTSKTSNPFNPIQSSDGDFGIKALGTGTGAKFNLSLDDKYEGILVGMSVSGVGIQPSTLVESISLSGGVTIVTLDTPLLTTASNNTVRNAEYVFNNSDGTLAGVTSNQVLKESAELAQGKPYIDFATAQTDISIGDLVSHEYFPVGTVVTAIGNQTGLDIGTRIWVSNTNTTATTAANQEIAFTSQTPQSDTWSNYKSSTPSEINSDDYEDDTYWPLDGQRYGIDPQHAQVLSLIHISEPTRPY